MIVIMYDHLINCQVQGNISTDEIGRDRCPYYGGEPAVHIYLPSIQETTKETL